MSKKILAGQLAEAVAPHFGGEAAATAQPSKAVAKILRQLAKQLTKQQGKQAKAAKVAATPTPLTAKRARKALVGELAVSLQSYLGPAEDETKKAPKGIAKAMKRLAGQVVKQRRKQAKLKAKQAAKETKQTTKAVAPVKAKAALPTAPRAIAPVRRPAAARKSATAPAVSAQTEALVVA